MGYRASQITLFPSQSEKEGYATVQQDDGPVAEMGVPADLERRGVQYLAHGLEFVMITGQAVHRQTAV